MTFYTAPDPKFNVRVASAHPVLTNHDQLKVDYLVDHYFVDIGHRPDATVEQTRYWTGLFSHRRDGVWKGMLRIDLSTLLEDTNARAYLAQLP